MIDVVGVAHLRCFIVVCVFLSYSLYIIVLNFVSSY